MTSKRESIYNDFKLSKRAVVPKSKAKFSVGDYVRISETRRVFKKGYLPSWTRELFKVVEIHRTQPLTYGICDYADELIKGKFYEQELQKSNPTKYSKSNELSRPEND